MGDFTRAKLLMAMVFAAYANAAADPGDSTRSAKWYVPHYMPIQFAGNIGFLSVGAGYNSNKHNYQLSLMYGYVPASAGARPIHTFAAKNNFPLGAFYLKNSRTAIPYLGLGLTVEAGGTSFFSMPSHFPESYYDFPKNLHVIAYGGARLQHLFPDDTGLFRGLEVYAEAGTIDVYLWYKSISSDIKFREIFSIALGANILLNHR